MGLGPPHAEDGLGGFDAGERLVEAVTVLLHAVGAQLLAALPAVALGTAGQLLAAVTASRGVRCAALQAFEEAFRAGQFALRVLGITAGAVRCRPRAV